MGIPQLERMHCKFDKAPMSSRELKKHILMNTGGKVVDLKYNKKYVTLLQNFGGLCCL